MSERLQNLLIPYLGINPCIRTSVGPNLRENISNKIVLSGKNHSKPVPSGKFHTKINTNSIPPSYKVGSPIKILLNV